MENENGKVVAIEDKILAIAQVAIREWMKE
jgi:hypothetical protein